MKARIEELVDSCYQPNTYAMIGRVGQMINEPLVRQALRALAEECFEKAALMQEERAEIRHGWDKHGDADAIRKLKEGLK